MADLDTPVPPEMSRYGYHGSAKWPQRPTRAFYADFIPLREWLHLNRAWIGSGIVGLFHSAARAEPPAVIDEGDDEFDYYW